MTWKQEAAQIIAEATKDIPANATVKERSDVIRAAMPHMFSAVSWGRKSWQAARRDYLVRYGYEPRTKKAKERKAAVVGDLPLFTPTT